MNFGSKSWKASSRTPAPPPVNQIPKGTLYYSDLFGLNVAEKPFLAQPGTYIQGTKFQMATLTEPVRTFTTWRMLIRRKDHQGRNTKMDWVEVSKDQLPAKLKTLALLQEIQL